MYTPQEIWDDFQDVYQVWFDALQQYSEMDLWRENPDGGWSLGQIYQHIINGAMNFQVVVVKELMANHEDADKEKSELGEISIRENAFPPRPFKVHRETANEAQMSNKITLRNHMKRAKRAVEELKEELEGHSQSGKYEHQIFGYLDALEWYQNIPMHWRHHLRQKDRVDLAFEQAHA